MKIRFLCLHCSNVVTKTLDAWEIRTVCPECGQKVKLNILRDEDRLSAQSDREKDVDRDGMEKLMGVFGIEK